MKTLLPILLLIFTIFGYSAEGDIIFTEFRNTDYLDVDNSYSYIEYLGYIELYNRTDSPINLTGWSVQLGLTMPITDSFIINSHDYAIIMSHSGVFLDSLGNTYCSSFNYDDQLDINGGCDEQRDDLYWNYQVDIFFNSSGVIKLLDNCGEIIDKVIYEESFQIDLALSEGKSIEFILDPQLNNWWQTDGSNTYNDYYWNWMPSTHSSNLLWNGITHEYGTPLDCASNLVDCAGICGGSGIIDSNGICCLSGNIDCCGICDGYNSCELPAIGDLNADGDFNVLDLISLVNCILVNNCSNIIYGCTGDMNGDGGWNVLDIVGLANCLLADNCS